MTNEPNLETEEIKRLRHLYQELKERLNEAEVALMYYSHVQNYQSSIRGQQTGITYQNALKEDFEQADNDAKTLIAGRRARDYFKRYAKD